MRYQLSITIVILAVTLVVTSADGTKPQARAIHGQGRSCVVNNRVYRHGQVFTIGNSRCIKYRCNNGNYNFFKEGCDAWGVCQPVGRQFDHDCGRYLCRATTVLGSYKKYQILPVSVQQCKDSRGLCRPPGSFFEYVMHGQLKKRCTCRPNGLSITYYCYD